MCICTDMQIDSRILGKIMKRLESALIFIIMTYNGLEMAAIVKLAQAMIAADGKIDDKEVRAMSVELLKFGVTHSSLQTIVATSQAMEYSHAVGIVSAMNEEQKKYVTGFLAFIMAIDGEIADSEIELWRLISTFAELPTMSISEATDFWRNH